MYTGKDVSRYSTNWGGIYCCRNKSEIEKHIATDIRLREEKMFLREKILIRKTGNEIVGAIDNKHYYYEQSLFSFGVSNNDYSLNFILSILNSRLSKYLLNENAFSKKETFPQIRLHWLKEFPIAKTNILDQQQLASKSETILTYNVELKNVSHKFQRSIERKFNLESLSKNLENWYLLSYSDFIKELAKKKIKLSLSDEAEWEEYFNAESKKALSLKSQIDATDKEIDQLVYKLYDLTEEEIAIVEKV